MRVMDKTENSLETRAVIIIHESIKIIGINERKRKKKWSQFGELKSFPWKMVLRDYLFILRRN